MVTTTFKQSMQLGVELPKADAKAQPSEKKMVQIAIGAKGGYSIEGKVIEANDRAQLKASLYQAIKNASSPQVVILGDKKAPHQSVVTALDIAQNLGINKLSIQVNKLNEKS